jgi:hypothetical protein
MEDFEAELREAFERRPAPPGLKRRLLEHKQMERRRLRRPALPTWMRMAASLLLVAALGGGFAWHRREEQRKGEEARRQVMIALRITGHALNQVNAKLAAHGRSDQN